MENIAKKIDGLREEYENRYKKSFDGQNWPGTTKRVEELWQRGFRCALKFVLADLYRLHLDLQEEEKKK